MRDKLFALLGIESGEESMVSMLLTQSVFLGIFFGSFDISAHSLFLSIFDEKMMAKAYVVSGLAGIVLTSLYTWLQTKLSFRRFATSNLLAVTVLTLLLWAGLLITKSSWIVFLVFIMLGPLNILAALGFWGTAGRLFTLRQGKRLFGLVDSGLIVGIIISCYTIPVVLSFNFESRNILLLSACSVFAAVLIQAMIGSKFRLVSTDKKEGEKKEKTSIFTVLRTNRYITIMAVFVALSVMTAFFVQYSFMAVTRQQYPAEEDMARFLGIFTGSMMIFTLLVKLLAFSYLIRNYGLKISLVISPILISVLAAVSILIGLTMGYTPAATSGFMIFFLILALGRLFSKSLKDSIESPSFKVIYQTLDEKIRFEVQSGMDGTVNEISALTTGLILAGMGMLTFITLIHFSFVLLVIIIIWIVTAFLLYREYRKSIRKALETTSPGNRQPLIAEGIKLKNRFSAGLSFRQDYYSLVSGDIRPLENNFNTWYFENIIRHTIETHDFNLVPALRRISGNTNYDEETRKKSEEIIRVAESYIDSQDSGKSAYARKLLYGTRVPQTAEILRLLRDNSIESKRFALYMIGKFRLTEMLTEACNCLANPSLETDASSVLISFGKDTIDELQRYSLTTSGNSLISACVLRILSKIPCNESSTFLFSRLWSTSRRLKETAVKGLLGNNYIPEGEDRDRLHQLITDTIALMTWNLAARVCLRRNNDAFLLGILEKDILRWNKFLFDILLLAYDRSSIEKIKENLEKDTVESGNFALEMIDIVIDESIKPKIIALLDIVPDEDRLKNLWHFFPGGIPAYEKLIEDIINRDYNLLNLWTKACTLRNTKEMGGSDFTESVSALLFSPEAIMQEEAAKLMSRSGKQIYRSVSERISGVSRKKLDRIIDGEYKDDELLFEKTVFLSKFFKMIPEDELIELAEKLVYVKDIKKNGQCAPECIIWDVKDENRVIVNHGGESRKYNSEGPCYVLPLDTVREFSRIFPESMKEILTYIDLNEVTN